MLSDASKGIKNIVVLGWGLQGLVQVKNLKDSFVKARPCVYVFLIMVQIKVLRKKRVDEKATILLSSTPQTKINQNTIIPTKSQLLSTAADNQNGTSPFVHRVVA